MCKSVWGVRFAATTADIAGRANFRSSRGPSERGIDSEAHAELFQLVKIDTNL